MTAPRRTKHLPSSVPDFVVPCVRAHPTLPVLCQSLCLPSFPPEFVTPSRTTEDGSVVAQFLMIRRTLALCDAAPILSMYFPTQAAPLETRARWPAAMSRTPTTGRCWEIKLRAIIHVTRPYSCHLDAAFRTRRLPACGFLNVTVLGLRGKDCGSAVASRIRELECAVTAHGALTAATAELAAGNCKDYSWLVMRYRVVLCRVS